MILNKTTWFQLRNVNFTLDVIVSEAIFSDSFPDLSDKLDDLSERYSYLQFYYSYCWLVNLFQ